MIEVSLNKTFNICDELIKLYLIVSVCFKRILKNSNLIIGFVLHKQVNDLPK